MSTEAILELRVTAGHLEDVVEGLRSGALSAADAADLLADEARLLRRAIDRESA